MKSKKNLFFFVCFFIGNYLSTARLHAKDELESLDYPELMVQPQASERILKENKQKNFGGLNAFWPVQASSLLTLVASSKASLRPELEGKDTESSRLKDGKSLATFISGGLLATTLAISIFYDPYVSVAKELKNKTTSSKKDLLARERLAEEALEDGANMASTIGKIGGVANLLTSVYLIDPSSNESRTLLYASVAASLLPLFIRTTPEKIWSKHQEYKKRIYGPLSWRERFQLISGLSPQASPQGNWELTPSVGFHLSF